MAALNSQIAALNCVSTPTSASFQRPLAPARISFKTSKFSTNALTSKSIGYHGHGGSALGAQMNLFGRFARIIKSYANAFISIFENPERIMEQAVLEMNEDLIRMRQATAPVLASQKQLENKYKSAQQASEDWYKRAQLALSRGDDNLAREALKQRKYYSDNASALNVHLTQQQVIIDNIVTNTRVLESKIQEAKSKRHTLKARAQSAKTAIKLTEMLHNVNPNSALSAFEGMEDKVLSMESRADALNQLATDDLEGKFAVLETFSVDDDLANLKREMCGNSSKGELPPGRTAVGSSGSTLFLNMEIEKELNELRTSYNDY